MQEQIKTEKIYSEPTALYQPDQNNIAEQANSIVIKHMHIIFIDIDLPKKL